MPEPRIAANQEIMLKWAEALESGDYEQGKGTLRRRLLDEVTGEDTGKVEQCCLDVLIDVCRANGLDFPKAQVTTGGMVAMDYVYRAADGEEYTESGVLPGPVMTYAGLFQTDPALYVPTEAEVDVTSATQANDQQGMPFPEIAAAVRYTYLPTEDTPPAEEVDG